MQIDEYYFFVFFCASQFFKVCFCRKLSAPQGGSPTFPPGIPMKSRQIFSVGFDSIARGFSRFIVDPNRNYNPIL